MGAYLAEVKRKRKQPLPTWPQIAVDTNGSIITQQFAPVFAVLASHV
jgi:hypothetical protein